MQAEAWVRFQPGKGCWPRSQVAWHRGVTPQGARNNSRMATPPGGGRGRPSSKAAVKHTGVFLNTRRAGNQKLFLQSELTVTRSSEPRPDRQTRAEKSQCPANGTRQHRPRLSPPTPAPRRPGGGFLSHRHSKTARTLKEDGARPPHRAASSSWGVPAAAGTPS